MAGGRCNKQVSVDNHYGWSSPSIPPPHRPKCTADTVMSGGSGGAPVTHGIGNGVG